MFACYFDIYGCTENLFACFQLFDRKFVDAVLNEWQKTIVDLPAGFRQAYEMVQYSSYYFLLNTFG